MNADKAKKCNTTCYPFLVMKVTRIEMSKINTKHHKRTLTSLAFRLPCLGPFIAWKTTHFIPQKIHLYQPALVKSCSLTKIQMPYPATIPLRFSHPDFSKTQNPAPACNWSSRIPLLFSAPIPNIATKISHIPHPAKPIVDPLNGLARFWENAFQALSLEKNFHFQKSRFRLSNLSVCPYVEESDG